MTGFENAFEKMDILSGYQLLIKDYLTMSNIEDANTIKNLIISKATSELSLKDLQLFKQEISQRGQQASGKDKIRLYELAAGLYNNTSFQELSPNISSQREFLQEVPPLEIAGGRVKRKVLGLKGVKSKEYEIVGGDTIYHGNGIFEISLDSKRNVGKYATASHTDSLFIKYNGGDTIQILDTNQRSIGIVNISKGSNKAQFELKSQGLQIELYLSFPNRRRNNHRRY